MNWYLATLKKYAVFNGRASRKEFLYFILFNIIVSILLDFVDLAIGKLTGFYLDPKSQTGLLQTLYIFIVIIPSFAVLVRRLHDTGRSGWWILWIFILNPILLLMYLVPDFLGIPPRLEEPLGILLIGLYLAIFIFTLLPSDPLPNKYGPNPTKD